MNAATQQILRWFLASVGGEEDEIETLIEALGRGIEKSEADSMELCAKLLAAARSAGATSDDGTVIARLFELHFELLALDAAEAKIDAMIEIREIATAPNAGPLANKVRDWKLKSLLDKIA